MKFTYSGAAVIFSARNSTVQDIKYAVIRTSTAPGAGKVVCFCTAFS
jgi:hypothetical protein